MSGIEEFRQLLWKALSTPEQRERHAAEQEEQRAQRVRKRLYRELAKKSLSPEEVDESHQRVMGVISKEQQ